jgi:hypothetical protein
VRTPCLDDVCVDEVKYITPDIDIFGRIEGVGTMKRNTTANSEIFFHLSTASGFILFVSKILMLLSQ